MSKRDIAAIQNLLSERAESIDVEIHVRIGGVYYHQWALDDLTYEEQSAIDSAFEEAIDEAYELLSERFHDALEDVELDEDFDPDEYEVEEQARMEANRPQRLAEQRALLLQALAEVDTEIEDLNSTLIA
jgi:hypothetical protein